MIPDLLFLLFASGLLAGASLIMFGKNPMVGVLGMLLAFLNASGLFILLGAEFLGLLLIMVYVGAIAVMFLFVLMTIDIDFATLKEGVAPYLPLGLLVVALLAAQLVMAASGAPALISKPVDTYQPQNIIQLGQILFTHYAIPFQIAGLVLLTAMIGAIVLTHRPREGVKRQSIAAQVRRTKDEALTLTNPQTGQGAGAKVAKHWSPKSVAAKPTKAR
jgi:NADH-quinone oxidoreductase subunit J